MEQTKRPGFALIGYGGAGGWHIEKVRQLKELIDVRGIYDIDPHKSAAAEKNGLTAYESLEQLLADPSVDFITVAIPNDVHKPVCLRALQAGKHVICEKPVALSSGELEEMIAAAEQNGVLFSVHHNRRWDEDYLAAKKLYEENTLGRVFNIESRVHGSRGIPGDWRNQKEKGGGMVLDWGVHLFDQLLMLTGGLRVTSVFAKLYHVTNTEVDDGFKVFLEFENGLTAQAEVGTSNFISIPRWYMQGENGTAQIDWGVKGKIVMVSDWENRDAVPVATAAGLTKTMAPRTAETIQEFPLPAICADVKDFYRNFVRAMAGQEQPIVTHSQIRRVMKLMEAVFRSGETGQAVRESI